MTQQPANAATSQGLKPARSFDLPSGWRLWPDDRKRALLRVLRSQKFRNTYEYDPVAFVHDCIDWSLVKEDGPTSYQEEILAGLVEHKREAVRGPHGIGKSTIGSWVIHWFSLTRDTDDWKLPTTASAWRQLKEYLWPEVHKWAPMLRWDIIGRDPYLQPRELQDLALRLDTGSAFAIASDKPAAIEGAHADRMLYLYDEAKTIEEATFDASEGAFSGAGEDTGREALSLILSTPGPPSGRFYEIHRRAPGHEHYRVLHVTKEMAIAAGRMSKQWTEQMALLWGEGSAIYQNRVEGEFAASDESSVIPLQWVEAANERWRALATIDIQTKELAIPAENLPPFTCVGADVADEGGDQTALALRHGEVIAEVRRYPMGDTMETTGHIVGVLRARGGYTVVDVIGTGAGPVARLKEQGHKVVPFNASEGSNAVDRSGELEFANRRAEAWWGLRERLDPSQPGGSQVCLPPDDYLTGDLTAPRWKTTSAGKILIESKDDIRKRLGRSTDTGDAVVQAFAIVPPPPRAISARGHRIPGR